MDMAKLKDYRKEILNAGGLQTLKESVIESGYVVQETSRKLKKILVSRSTRLRMAFGTAKAQAHGMNFLMLHLRLKKPCHFLHLSFLLPFIF